MFSGQYFKAKYFRSSSFHAVIAKTFAFIYERVSRLFQGKELQSEICTVNTVESEIRRRQLFVEPTQPLWSTDSVTAPNVTYLGSAIMPNAEDDNPYTSDPTNTNTLLNGVWKDDNTVMFLQNAASYNEVGNGEEWGLIWRWIEIDATTLVVTTGAWFNLGSTSGGGNESAYPDDAKLNFQSENDNSFARLNHRYINHHKVSYPMDYLIIPIRYTNTGGNTRYRHWRLNYDKTSSFSQTLGSYSEQASTLASNGPTGDVIWYEVVNDYLGRTRFSDTLINVNVDLLPEAMYSNKICIGWDSVAQDFKFYYVPSANNEYIVGHLDAVWPHAIKSAQAIPYSVPGTGDLMHLGNAGGAVGINGNRLLYRPQGPNGTTPFQTIDVNTGTIIPTTGYNYNGVAHPGGAGDYLYNENVKKLCGFTRGSETIPPTVSFWQLT